MKRPLGVTILSSVMVAVGGLLTLVVFILILDSIRLFGMDSILIHSPRAFLGFLFYGMMPVLFYFAGVNMYMSSRWARMVSLYVVPVIGLLFAMNLAYNVALSREFQGYIPAWTETVAENSDIFFNALFLYLLFFLPIEYYLTRPRIAAYFNDQPPSA